MASTLTRRPPARGRDLDPGLRPRISVRVPRPALLASPAAELGRLAVAVDASTWRLLGAVVFALIVVEAAHLVLPDLRRWIGTFTFASAAVSSALCFVAANRAGPWDRDGWLLRGFAAALVGVGLLIARVPTVIVGHGVLGSTDDLVLLAPGAFIVVESLRTTIGPSRWLARTRLLLDAVITVAVLGTGLKALPMLYGSSIGDVAMPMLPAVAVYSGALYAVLLTGRRVGLQPMTTYYGSFVLGAAALAAAGIIHGTLAHPATPTEPAPGVALWNAGLLLFALGALRAARLPSQTEPVTGHLRASYDSRLQFAPMLAAVGLAVWITWQAAHGPMVIQGTAFSLLLALFSLIGLRLVLALLEIRLLLRRVKTAGRFEDRLRELGLALNSTLDLQRVLRLICRSGQEVLGADAVLIWRHSGQREIEVVESYGRRVNAYRGRRLSLGDQNALAVRVLAGRRPEIVRDVRTSGRANQFLSTLLRAECLLAVPILKGRRELGVIEFAHSRDRDAFQDADLAKAELLAAHAAVAIENAQLYEQTQQQLELVSAQFEFVAATTQSTTPEEIGHKLMSVIETRVSIERAVLYLGDRGELLPRPVACAPASAHTVPPPVSSTALNAYRSRRPKRTPVSHPAEEPHQPAPLTPVELAVPLVANERSLGVLSLDFRADAPPTDEHVRLVIPLVQHAALSMENLILQEHARQVEALKTLDRMKSILLSTVTHELRSPLSSIKGYTSFLLNNERRIPNEEKRECLEIIEHESDRLDELIGNLLEMSQLEEGRLRMERARVRLRCVAEEALARARLIAEDHVLRLEWEDDVEVMADERRILQVMQNLLKNALKYSPEGGEVLLRGAVEGDQLIVSVHDQGVGIPPHELGLVFERFHRVQGELSVRVGGAGLGLAICKGLVEAHHGRMGVRSRVGEGSVFFFTLPVGSS